MITDHQKRKPRLMVILIIYDSATHNSLSKFRHAVHLVYCSSPREDRHNWLAASNRNVVWCKDRNAANRLMLCTSVSETPALPYNSVSSSCRLVLLTIEITTLMIWSRYQIVIFCTSLSGFHASRYDAPTLLLPFWAVTSLSMPVFIRSSMSWIICSCFSRIFDCYFKVKLETWETWEKEVYAGSFVVFVCLPFQATYFHVPTVYRRFSISFYFFAIDRNLGTGHERQPNFWLTWLYKGHTYHPNRTGCKVKISWSCER